MRLILIGAPGTGKSTLAAHLAARGWQVWESDDAVERVLGRSLADLHVAGEQDALRQAEQQAVCAQLSAPRDGMPTPQVVVVGSGAIESPLVRQALTLARQAGDPVVHLDADLAVVSRRLALGAPGGLAPVLPRALWGQLRRERLPRYRAAASHTLDTTGLSACDACDKVLDLLGQ